MPSDVPIHKGGQGGVSVGARPEFHPDLMQGPKPRNPRHFDGIEGGRKRVSDTFTHKNNGSEEHNHCFMHHFGVKTLSETLFPRLS